MTRSRPKRARVRMWTSETLSDDIRRVIDRLSQTDDVIHIAIMPDVHLARGVCVGTAFATSRLIYPDTIGGDIGCGMAAVAVNAAVENLPDQDGMTLLLRELRAAVPIQRHYSRGEAVPARIVLPDVSRLSDRALVHLAETEGARQIGTLGTGNHFLELQADDAGQLWLMVHSGSRALGQAIRGVHVPAQGKGASLGLARLDAQSEAGQQYLQDMEWARTYASTSRRIMLERAGALLDRLFGWGLLLESLIDCDHNHIKCERHFGSDVFVHRKGAQPAGDGQPGLLPGSMATASYHVTGRGEPESLCSSAHGAGRSMTRLQARRLISRQALQEQLGGIHYESRNIGALCEEAPAAYKDIHAIVRCQRRLIRVRRVLTPILSYRGL